MADRSLVRLKIVSRKHSPEEIAARIGIQPDKAWRIGDPVERTTMRRKDHVWMRHSRLPESASIEEHIDELLDCISPFAAQIKQISEEEDVQLSCVMYCAEIPALNFSKSVLAKLGNLGASLDIDLYLGTESAE